MNYKYMFKIQSTLDYPELLGPWKSLPDNKFPDIQSESESAYHKCRLILYDL